MRPRLLARLDPATREALEFLLGFPHDTAGGIMTTEFVAVPASRTVEQVLAHLRAVARTKETIYAVYVVSADGRLEHVVSLRELLMARPDALGRRGRAQTPSDHGRAAGEPRRRRPG